MEEKTITITIDTFSKKAAKVVYKMAEKLNDRAFILIGTVLCGELALKLFDD